MEKYLLFKIYLNKLLTLRIFYKHLKKNTLLSNFYYFKNNFVFKKKFFFFSRISQTN
jgi:hypothetical protein